MESIIKNPDLLVSEEEIWKAHPTYYKYEISTFGNVRRADNKRLLKPWKNDKGYMIIHLRSGIDNPNGKYLRVHKLVAETFLGVRGPEYEVDHLDRQRDNNQLSNIRWATRAENNKNRTSSYKQKIYMNKPELVLIKKESDELIREFKNLAQAAEEMNVSPFSIRNNIHNYKQHFVFGRFMTKEDYLKKFDKIKK